MSYYKHYLVHIDIMNCKKNTHAMDGSPAVAAPLLQIPVRGIVRLTTLQQLVASTTI